MADRRNAHPPRSRRDGTPRRRGLLVALLGLVASIATSGCTPEPDRPPTGVLLVLVDTLRADHVGVYGGPVATPEMDRLARDGIWIERAFTPTPTTGPAHASLFTGLHPWRHGVLDNAVALPGGTATLAEGARAAGFATAAFVSSYILDPRFAFDRGFDTYVFEPDQPFRYKGRRHDAFYAAGGATTDRALAWIAAHADEPFFVFVHYFDPHAPYEPPAGFAPQDTQPVDLTGKRVPSTLADAAELASAIRRYRGEVAYVDREIGRLVAELRRLGRIDETAIVVTADHGEGLGDHGHLAHGANLFDELVRVPMIARGPSVRGGRRLEGEAQLEDLKPTLLAWIAMEAEGAIDGIDLLPWWRGERPDSPRREAMGRRQVYRGLPHLFYVARGDERWIGRGAGGGRRYDLATDARAEGGTATTELPASLADELSSSAATEARVRPDDLSDETRAALEALGYAE